MAGLAVGGLASGMDTDTIVSQLLALEKAPRSRMQLRETFYETRESALNDVASRLRNLKTAALDLGSALAWTDAQSASSSDTSRLAVRRLAGAAPGGYTVDVLSLARAEQHSFAYTASAADTTFSLTQGSSTTNYTIAAGATAQQAADSINGTSGSPVTAVVVDDGATQRLVLTSRKTGASAANGFTYNVGDTDLADEKVAAGQAATYRLNGEATVRSSETNTVTNALPGVEMSFKALTVAGAPVSVTVSDPSADPDKIKDRIKAFVSQYNSTVSFIRGKLTEAKPASPSTSAEAAQGVLRNDTGLNDLLSQLRGSVVAQISNGNPAALDQLSELGITTGAATGGAASADSLSGLLVVDDAKLTAALDSDPTAVRRLLGGITGTDGFAQKIDALVDPYTRTGGTLASRAKEADSQASQQRDAMARLDSKLELTEKRLRAQFASLETILSKSQSQQSWLTSQISSLG